MEDVLTELVQPEALVSQFQGVEVRTLAFFDRSLSLTCSASERIHVVRFGI